MIEIKAPNPIDFTMPTLFLAGSIEMGTAEKWQERVVRELRDWEGAILNPCRDDWDSSWVQSINNPQFREQVEWELEALENSDWIFMYFDPQTKSPITLLELGLSITLDGLIVVCPDGFWRKGNVEIVCSRFKIPLFKSIEEGLGELKTAITS